MAMKRAEMGTELIDHLTPEEKHLLSRLNPEITDHKETLIKCKTDRIEVSKTNLFYIYVEHYMSILLLKCIYLQMIDGNKESGA